MDNIYKHLYAIHTGNLTVDEFGWRCGQVKKEIDQQLSAQLDRLEELLKDEENYRPYLVVRHKLGLEANQGQAKLIAAAVNHLRKDLRKAIEEERQRLLDV